MKNRIEIDGVWYVKEETEDQSAISQLGPGIKYDGYLFESNLYCFDCTRIYDEDEKLYEDSSVSIEFTNKTLDMDRTELWDNTSWMNGFLKNDIIAITDARESLCAQGMLELREVLTTLKEKEWI